MYSALARCGLCLSEFAPEKGLEPSPAISSRSSLELPRHVYRYRATPLMLTNVAVPSSPSLITIFTRRFGALGVTNVCNAKIQ